MKAGVKPPRVFEIDMTYAESIDWLYSTQTFGIKLGLDAPRRLLREFLAYPAHDTKVIHVAGTNGKGSTCAMIDSLAWTSGVRSGLFTSPHLVDFRERARVNGVLISEEKTARLLTELREMVKDWEHHPTFFELTLALAMRHFRDEKCELIVLETGMGGRLDATTAVPADVAVLTPIALDHTKWLGETLEEVAAEKAAIAVKKKPLISAEQKPEARCVIEQHANEMQSPLKFMTEPLVGYPIGLPGSHQRENAALATEAFYSAGYALTYDIVLAGLSRVRWPGRFDQRDLEGRQSPLILDAAHNPHAAQALVETWNEVFPKKKGELIFGAVEDKDVSRVLELILPLVEKVYLIPVNSPRGLASGALKEIVQELGGSGGVGEMEVVEGLSLEEAMEATKKSDYPVLLTGSLFLLGEAMGLLEGQKTRSSEQ